MKRILSLILSLILVMGILPCLGISAEEEAMTTTERVIAQLRDIGLLQGDENGEIEPAATLSRAEFVTLIARVLNMEKYYENMENDIFVDVPQNHWAKSAILACAKAGYVVGTEENFFSPEDNVSVEQAVKIMVKVLGYEYLAQEKGGYPAGHIYVANRLEIMDNIVTPQNEAITMGDTAHLFFNSLEVILTEEAGYSGESIFFSNSAQNTLLGKYMGLARGEATVDAIYGSSLIDEEVETTNQIIIGGVRYEYDGADVRALLGRTVEYFYTISEKQIKSTLKSVMLKEEENVEVSFYLQDLLDAKSGLITYEDANEKVAEVKISPKLKYVYNYELLLDYDVKKLKDIQTGMLTLVDNNNDGTYDVAFVLDYTTFVVETKSNSFIQGKNNTELVDLTKEDRILYLNYYDGRVVLLDKVKEYHVLSVIQGDKILDIRINDVNATGIYEAYDDDTVTVNGVEYEVAKDLYAPDIKIGEQVSVYLNAFNQVAFMKKTAVTALQVGYLARLAETENPFSTKLNVRMFTDTGELKNLTLATRIIINENYYHSGREKDLVLKALEYTKEMNIKPQLVKYALNEAGEIYELRMAADHLNPDEDGFVMAIGADTVNASTGEVTTQGVSLRYHGTYGIDKSGDIIAKTDSKKTKVFLVPTWKNIGSADARDFILLSPGSITGDSTYNMKLYYDSKKNTFVDYVVIHHATPRAAKYAAIGNKVIGIYMDMGTVWQNGEARTAIEYFNGSSTVSAIIADYSDGAVPALKKGDVFRMTKNWAGEVDSVERIYERETGNTVTYGPTQSYAINSGEIVYEKDSYVRVSKKPLVLNDSSMLSASLFPKAANNIIVVEEKDGNVTVSKGSADDLKVGTKVFYIYRTTTMTLYVVYR